MKVWIVLIHNKTKQHWSLWRWAF